jgi:hypothetical protein
MAKVKIQGNASGTGVITLIAPNTNTDRTVTLPDESITLGGGVDGIVSTADATAITIDSNENVGIGVVPKTWHSAHLGIQFGGLGVLQANKTQSAGVDVNINSNSYVNTSGQNAYIVTDEATNYQMVNGEHIFKVASSGTADAAITWTNALTITNDGRGLSQFTAKAWVNFNGTGTVAIRDSHNVSSVTDSGTGLYVVNLTVAMANTNYAVVSAGNVYAYSGTIKAVNNTTTQFDMQSHSSNSLTDRDLLTAVVFGD